MSRGSSIVLRVLLYGGAVLATWLILMHPGAIMRTLGVGGARTVRQIVSKHEAAVQKHFASTLLQHGLHWPPQAMQLLAFKQERQLELWAGDRAGALVLLARYPILAASGHLGPKQREGDGQVPEGDYAITHLNPNSQFHLSMLVDYPNAADIARSSVPREAMGGEIYVHGGAVSVGCIAIGDPAIEEVFTVVALAPAGQRRIVIAPYDARAPGAAPPEITTEVDDDILRALRRFPLDGLQR